MKTVIRAAASIIPTFTLLVSSYARDLLPERHIETVPSSDSSVQQCLVFRTVPGVLYQVESSHDLSQWTADDEIYGVGHEYAVTMREFTPPPPPPPGSGPPTNLPPFIPAKFVTLRIQPSSGIAGGAVVSWRSLDDGSPVNRLLAQTMAPGWIHVPFLSERYGNFYFSIGCGNMAPIPPPVESGELGPKDTAMLTQLETSFPAMNQAVIESTNRPRNVPNPAPPDPQSRKFMRIRCDWGLDTDLDGTPDWMEFEMQGAAADGLRGDAFLADTNHNGIPDGDELDFDEDGVADAMDIGSDDASASYTVASPPRYALFQIANAASTAELPNDGLVAPLQISDQGTVLYADGTWKGGTWIPLTAQGNGLTGASARAINDKDVILGFASSIAANPGGTRICYWPDPAANTQPIPVAQGSFIATTDADSASNQGYDLVYNLLAPGPVLSNDGTFHGAASRWEDNRRVFKGYLRWKLPAAGETSSSGTPTPGGMRYDGGGILSWGLRPKPGNEFEFEGGQIKSGDNLRDCDFVPLNISLLPNGQSLLMRREPDKNSEVRGNGKSFTDTIYAKALDMAADGTAIGKTSGEEAAPILINGKWIKPDKFAPGIPADWTSKTSLLDTTPGGWVLAKHKPASGSALYGVFLPIRLNGVDPTYTPPAIPEGQTAPEPPDYFAGGVDHLSTRAEGGDGYMPELWIMAPIGGSTPVRWRSPLHAACKLKPECDKAAFTPQEITASASTVQVSGNALQVGEDAMATDFPATLKLGSAQQASTSIPIKVKRMKKRTVNVALHYVYSVDANGQSALPFYQPTKTDLEPYLNKVFGPQVNVNFTVSDPFIEGSATAGINFDGSNNGKLDTNNENEVSAATPNVKRGSAGTQYQIEIWVIGGGKKLNFPTGFGAELYGWTNPARTKIIIDGNQATWASIANNGQMKAMVHTIAHEMGHTMIGGNGHPSEGGYQLEMEWPTRTDPYIRQRLMCPGGKANHNSPGCTLIKREWDRIDAWLANEEKEGRL